MSKHKWYEDSKINSMIIIICEKCKCEIEYYEWLGTIPDTEEERVFYGECSINDKVYDEIQKYELEKRLLEQKIYELQHPEEMARRKKEKKRKILVEIERVDKLRQKLNDNLKNL